MQKKKVIIAISIVLIVLIVLMFVLLGKEDSTISNNDDKNQDIVIDNKADSTTNENVDNLDINTEDGTDENNSELVLVSWAGDNVSFNQRYSNFYQKIYSNDDTWDVANLDVYAVNRTESFRCFHCGDWFNTTPIENYNQYGGADDNYVFLLPGNNWGIKNDVIGYPLVTLGDQSLEGILYYTEGSLILFPFSFSVDAESFKAAQGTLQSQIIELPNRYNYDEIIEASGNRWIKVNNGNIVYDKFIGDDKDYVYYRDFPEKDSYGNPDTSHISINRIRKQSDFKIMNL